MYRLIEKLHLERYLNSRLILAIDLVVSGVASLCALVLVRLLLPPLSNISKFALLWIGCAVVYSFITFFLLKTYRSVIRHSTLREIAKFVVAVIGKELLLGLTILLYPPTPLFGMHMLALLLFDLLLTLCGLILIRVAMIIVYDLVKNNLKSRKQHQLVLVYGLSEKSVSLVTRLQSSPHYKVVGFLTFGRRMKNHTIAECPVYYFENEYSIRYLRQRYDIDAVLFPTNEEAQTEQERLIRYCVESNLKILIAPPIDEVIDGKIMRQSIREIKIEDLLGRPEIKISLDEIRANFREKTVMVTGAAGSIGSELCRQLAQMNPAKIVVLDICENGAYDIQQDLKISYGDALNLEIEICSVTQREALRRVFEKHHPQIVIHAAAHKHVPLMEKNCTEAVFNNVFGTRNLVELCEQYHVQRFMMVSTDKAVNPTNVMGATKRMCEMIVQSASTWGSTVYSATRFGNVLGSAGSVIPLFKHQIARGGPITLTDKRIIRYFMTIQEASQLVLQSGSMARNGELFVLDMGQPVKILELAESMIRLSGAEDIEIVETGLRPGEKLYEELLVKTEKLDTTDNSMIFIEKDTPLPKAEIDRRLKLLEKACAKGDDAVREALRQAVPTFRSPEEVNATAEQSEEMKMQKTGAGV